jgi:hypothetical protein
MAANPKVLWPGSMLHQDSATMVQISKGDER